MIVMGRAVSHLEPQIPLLWKYFIPSCSRGDGHAEGFQELSEEVLELELNSEMSSYKIPRMCVHAWVASHPPGVGTRANSTSSAQAERKEAWEGVRI